MAKILKHMTHVYDPKHTDEKPYQTIYTYENERLVKVTDPLGKASTLSYNTGNCDRSKRSDVKLKNRHRLI
ncbi:hypothetical protein P4U65_24790 [Bacillus pacificus]|nr:hypothetical protein [Bacillus pacificus]